MGEDIDQDGQEEPKCHSGNDHNGNKERESPSEANDEKDEDRVATVVFGSHMQNTKSLPPNIKNEMQGMFLTLEFSLMVDQKLVEDQGK